MNRTVSTLLASVLTAGLTLPTACGKKNDGGTTPPDDGNATPTDDGAQTVAEPQAEPPPEQDPDPAELAQGVDQVLGGHYEAGIAILDPIYADMREPSQYRASGLAGGWLSVAHAQIVFENAEAPAKYALEMAGKLQDPEVDAVAKLGHGAYLLAQEDYEAAKQALQAASAAAPSSAPGAYAHVLHAEALIGTAFGSAENTQVENPADLDAAKSSYEAAITAAGTSDILLGRAKEGLAAVAKYQRDKEALCKNAFESVDHYKAAAASTFLLDGPSRLAADAKCE